MYLHIYIHTLTPPPPLSIVPFSLNYKEATLFCLQW